MYNEYFYIQRQRRDEIHRKRIHFTIFNLSSSVPTHCVDTGDEKTSRACSQFSGRKSEKLYY